MIKFTSNSDFDFKIESVSVVTDEKVLTKRASAKELLKFEKTANQTDLHVIALGAYEGTGYNRNGDCFKESECVKNHNYFVKAGRAIHRHHKNKPSDPKFGVIKASAYNEPMKRIELIIGLDNDKCSDILNEQEKRGHTNWSMASKQAHDICSWCGHKAKNDSERCAHIPKNIGDIDKTGEFCGMINPDPKWFEISYVHRPADRIGMSLKLASTDIKPLLPRDYLNVYGDLYVPAEVLTVSKQAADKRKILNKLSEIEKHVEAIANSATSDGKDKYIADHASKLNVTEELSKDTLDELRKQEPGKLLRILADKGIVFSPGDFVKYIFNDRVGEADVKGMKSHLPKVFSDACSCGANDVVNNERFEPDALSGIPPEIKNMISGLIPGFSMFSEPAVRRVMRITIIGSPGVTLKKEAGQQPTNIHLHKELAKQYAAYKLAALNHIVGSGIVDEDLFWNLIIQNRR